MTELVSGLDIVREQFWLAAGRALSAEAIAAAERAVEPAGHAIEVRIAAEDPTRAFAPTPGLIRRWAMPAGPGVRVDTAVAEGDRVPPEYDNLIAKIMVHAGDRAAAVRRLRRALDETEIAGIQTTLPFHRFVARSPAFRDGRLSTGWVEEWWDGPAGPRPRQARRPAGRRARRHRARAGDRTRSAYADDLSLRTLGGGRPERGHRPMAAMSDRRVSARDEEPGPGARIVNSRAVRVGVAHASVEAIVIEPPEVPLAPAPHVVGAGMLGGVSAESLALAEVPGDDDGIAIVDGVAVRVRLGHLDGVHGLLTEVTGDGPVRTPVLLMPLERHASPMSGVVRREIVVDGWRVEVEIESERRASLRDRARRGREATAHGGPTHVRAIIPGRIVSVSIVPGDPVEAGQQLLVVEAMKMQNELRAPRDGIVSSVAVGVGGTIEVGDLLLVLE